MLKGHTKIILKNEQTGEVEVHEDENLITNALDKIININAGLNRAPNDFILPIANKALGGIMLFDGELTESEDNIHFPTEAHIVGWAGQTQDANDRFRGSYNFLESGKTEHGFVSVWDFGTTQANGTIKAVARTSNWCCESSPFFHSVINCEVGIDEGLPSTDRSWMPLRYDGEYLYMLKGNSSTHIMRLARVKVPLMRFGCADFSGMARQYEVIASWNTLVTEYSYTYYGQERTAYVYADDPYMYEDGGDGFIYCMFYGTEPQNGTYFIPSYPYDITYFTIKYSDETYRKSETVRVNTGLGYYVANSVERMHCAYRNWGHVNGGNLYRASADRKVIYRIPLDTPSAYSAIRVISADSGDVISFLDRVNPHEGGLFFNVYHYTTTGYCYLVGFLYPDGYFVLPDTSYGGTYDSHGTSGSSVYTRYRNFDDDLTVWGDYTDSYDHCSWAANYLGTINNLASAITKTAAQSMKIIYTLTDVEE